MYLPVADPSAVSASAFLYKGSRDIVDNDLDKNASFYFSVMTHNRRQVIRSWKCIHNDSTFSIVQTSSLGYCRAHSSVAIADYNSDGSKDVMSYCDTSVAPSVRVLFQWKWP
jgi:hypothetical protein